MEKQTVKDLRIAAKLTQKDVARKTGFSKDYISMIENGKRSPSDKAKEKFANALGVSTVQFFLALQRTNSVTKLNKEET